MDAVLSFIFRHAPRLTRLYGPASPPPLAGRRFGSARALLPAGPALRAGTVTRHEGQVETRPLPPRARSGHSWAARAMG